MTKVQKNKNTNTDYKKTSLPAKKRKKNVGRRVIGGKIRKDKKIKLKTNVTHMLNDLKTKTKSNNDENTNSIKTRISKKKKLQTGMLKPQQCNSLQIAKILSPSKIRKENDSLNESNNKKRKLKKRKKKMITNEEENKCDKLDYQQRKREKIKEKMKQTISTSNVTPLKQKKVVKSLRTRMLEKLQSARFRYINEQIYSSHSKETQQLFSSDPEAFHAYHEGYHQQMNKWPINPLDVIIECIEKLPKTHVIADFGCGDARLAESVKHKVHSFDLVSKNKLVTACDMANVPLPKNSVNIVVFCLSLMGTNLKDYILEANRVLKQGGTLKIAEVESRFENVNHFVASLKKFNFKLTWNDLSHNLFYFLDFQKVSNIKHKNKLPTISLNPCLYKKR